MNCLIVDDDAVARLDFENKIRQVSFLNLVDSCSSALEATDKMMKEKVDLIILDVMLPEMNGLQLMKAFERERPQVILVSSDKKFAADAFDYDVTDFLVKPVSDERFLKAIAKARKFYESSTGKLLQEDQDIFIRVNSRLVKVDTRDVLFIEALADYVTLHSAHAKYTFHSTMKGIENMLPGKHFFRAHNSYIIRLDKISAIEDNCMVIGEKLIPVSRSKMKSLLQRLKFVG